MEMKSMVAGMDSAQEVGEKDGGALEHADQVQRLVCVVGGDLGGQARHLGAGGLLVEERLAQARVEDGHQAKRVAFTKARASSMDAGSTRPAVSHSSRHWEIVRMAWSSWPLEASSSRPPCSRSMRITRSLTM